MHPTWAGAELSLDQPDDTLLDPTATKLYKSITRFRMLLSQYTRFDITYAVNQLVRAMNKPSKLHMTAAKHFLRYLKGNMSLALTYKTSCFKLTGVCDASCGNNLDNGKSTSGYLFMIAGGPLSFTTALQSVTTQSTMEAELISMALASKEAIYLSNMMAELGFGKLFNSVPLFVKNTGALHIAGNSTYSSRTKHIALRFFFLKELIKEERITIHHEANTKQLADIGTKLLSKSTHQHLQELIKTYGYTKTNEG